MKKHERGTLVLVLMIVAIFGISLSIHGQDKGTKEGALKEKTGFTIAKLVIGTGVDKREPVGVAEVFPASAEKVYCFLEATGIAKDTEVSFVWFYGQKEMLKITLPVKMGSRWRTFACKNLRGLKGEWKVEIRDPDGNLLKDIKFKVE